MGTRMTKMPSKNDVNVETNINNIQEKNKPDHEEVKIKKVFDQSDGVKCKSVVQGGLFVVGIKTGMIYQFVDYGDVSEIEYRDLVAMVRSKDINVFEPRFVIEDDDFIAEYPQIEKFYTSQFSVKDLKNILALSTTEMVNAINRLPKGAVEHLKTIAATQVANGLLDSVSKIKALDKVFGTELDLVHSAFPDA